MTKQLPHNLEAEASLLGSIIIDNDSLFKIADTISDDDFFSDKHKYIYRAITGLYEKHKPIDVLTVSDRLKTDGFLEMIGGPSYLTELTNFVPTAAHVEQYAEIVAQKAVRRRLIGSGTETVQLGYDESKPVQDIVESAETALFNVSEKSVKQTVDSLENIIADSFERFDNLHKNKGASRGLPTGFTDIDDILGGIQPSDLLILAARPSMGKTAFSLNLAHNIAAKTLRPVLFFSLEMSKEQLVDRLLSMQAGIDSWALRTGNLSDKDFEKLADGMGALSQVPIFIDDTASLTVSDMRTKARRLAHKEDLGMIVVDYLQLMSGGARFKNSDSRVQEISEISRGLKAIAKELNVPVIALSQLSRSVESRRPQIPQLADLRESGSIEQDADVVAFIYREEYYNPETDKKNITEILIKKHRNGATGTVELFFDKEQQKFRSLAKGYDPFKN